jgi:hypothetical protein
MQSAIFVNIARFSTSPASQTTAICLVSRCERKQSDVARLLDRTSKTPLVRRADARQTPGNDLAALRYKTLQQANVAVRDRIDLFRTELADLLAPKELATAARTTGGTRTRRTAASTTVGALARGT